MPIAVSCVCGKQFRAPDSSAGRRGKCPSCGSPLQVPDLPAPASADDPFAIPAAARPAPARAAPAARSAPPVRAAPVRPSPAPAPASDPADDDYGAYDLKPSAPARSAALPPIPRPAAAPAYEADDDAEDDGDEPMTDVPPPASPVRAARARSTPTTSTSGARLARGTTGGPSHRVLYVVLAVALLPLAWSVLGGGESFGQRFAHTLEHHPEALQSDDVQAVHSQEDLAILFPGHRLDGALHARETKAHWLYAALSAGLFFAGTLVVLPRAATPPRHLLAAGLFTGTVGILLLLGVQLAAAATDGRMWVGRSVVVLVFYVIKLIGFSYHAATNPDTNLFVSLFGFTFGVGMCEELCKALPLIWVFSTREGMGWRDACRWGFICGVGFGVSEGVTYSADRYNGVSDATDYVVRFVSCVSLHAVWTAAVGVTLYRRQNLLHDHGHWLHFLLNLVVLLIVPMLLHGLYDTLLKKDHEAMALGVALLSVGWLAWNVEKMLRAERDDPRLAAATA